MGPEHKPGDALRAVANKEKLSEELFYHGEKGDIEKCKELLNNGADVNWTANEKLWFRTPLMQAAKSGMTEVCQLYLEHEADINAFTVSRFTALILAARYGHTETCQFLLTKGANINNQTKNGETALMWAADHGHPSTCKLLLEAGAEINLQDKYGITALIRAARGGHLQTCTVLMDFGADVTAVSTLGNQVWDAEQWAKMNKHRSIVKLIQSYKIRCSLLKDGSDPPSYVTLNVCGAVNAGKTTLIRNLQLTLLQRRRHLDQPDTSQDMASRTAGIEVGIINVPGVGEFRKMDMAGHSWAFTSNEYFIGKRTSISLVLFDLSKTDKEIEDDLFHHLGCLKARETKCGVLRYRPEVVLIATHPDKLASDPQPRANAYFRMVMDSFQAYMNFFLKVMVLNCTNPNILDFNALRECLKTLRGKIIKNSERVPRLCVQLLPRIRALAKKRSLFPVVSWEEFFREVKEVNNTADEEGVRNVAFYLNESAEIVNDNSPELRDKVVLDVNWLTSHIFGIALAPSNFPRSLRSDRQSGMVEKADLQASFPECPLDQLMELFVRFEVCIPWDEHNILCENYLFPSHLEQDRSNLDDVWPQFGISDQDLCVVGRIVECKNKMDALPCGFFPKLQIRLLKRFGHRSPVWHRGIKIADDVVEILVTLSSSLTAVSVCVWAPKGCEERCYASMKFIETLMEGLRNEVAGGLEFVHKAMSIKMLYHKRFEGYLLKDVDEALSKNEPNARVVLESCGVNELAVDVKYCGIRRYVCARDHISHMPLRDRKELSKLLDSDCKSNLSLLSEQLGVGSVPVENEDTGPSGFTSVIPKSETDHFLSQCALQSDLRATRLIDALERMNRFEAANVVSRWLSSIDVPDDAMSMYKTRSESSSSERSSSVSSRRRGTSGASEHCEIHTTRTEGSNVSEGSSLGLAQNGLSSARGPCTCLCARHRYDSSEHSFSFGMHRDFPRGERASSHGSVPDNAHIKRLVNSEYKMRSTSEPSEHSCVCSAEESCCAGSPETLSCEESKNRLTEQIVPQPRSSFIFEPCGNCQHCARKLSLPETPSPKPCDSDLESTLSRPIQISQNDNKGETSKEESLPTAETGEPDMKTSFPPSSLVSELSSRLSLSWRPVAWDLGLRNSDLSRFEEASLFRDQASTMLHYWLSSNSCTLECKHCEQVILERLGEAFENAHRADLKDLLENCKERDSYTYT